jgi:hypothetical protein
VGSLGLNFVEVPRAEVAVAHHIEKGSRNKLERATRIELALNEQMSATTSTMNSPNPTVTRKPGSNGSFDIAVRQSNLSQSLEGHQNPDQSNWPALKSSESPSSDLPSPRLVKFLHGMSRLRGVRKTRNCARVLPVHDLANSLSTGSRIWRATDGSIRPSVHQSIS